MSFCDRIAAVFLTFSVEPENLQGSKGINELKLNFKTIVIMNNRNREERIRFRYGICLNEGCSKCKSKEVQKILARKEFVCEECGKALRECPPPTTWWERNGKKVIIGAVAIILVCLIVVYVVRPKSQTIAPQKEQKETPVDMTKDSDVINTMESSAKAVDTMQPKVEVSEDKVQETPVSKQPTVIDGYGKVDLGYGMYVGDLKNGKPHGHGTITYTSSHKIVESKDFIANPGDKFEGDFREGRISSIGYWYHDNGEQTAIKP